MNQPKKCTAIKSLLFLALMLTGAAARADGGKIADAGAVTHVSGPLLATKADGSSRILAPNSAVEPGDTLITQKNGYAQIKFSDGSMLILQPSTTLTIDKFSYDASKPEADAAAFTLQQGGVRSNAGLLGKRSKDRVTLKTPVATIDMQDASVIIQYQVQSVAVQAAQAAAQQAWLLASTAALDASLTATRTDAPAVMAIRPMTLAQAMPPKPPGLAPGLYVQVIDGLINVSNPAGSSNFSAGQFGFTPNFKQPPVVIPKNPGLLFTPPQAFTQQPLSSNSGVAPKSAAVDCEVR